MRTEQGGQGLRARQAAWREERPAPQRRPLREVAPPPEEESVDEPVAPAWFAVARGAALFVGCVTLLNLLGEMRFPHFSSSPWWIDLQPLPKPLARGYLALTSALLMFFCVFPRMNAAARRLAAVCTFGLLGAALWNTYRFYQLVRGGQLHTDVPIPFTLHVACTVAVILPGLLASYERFNFLKDVVFGWSTVGVCIVGFALAQCFCLGKSAERCPSDAVLVFADAAESEKMPQAPAERVHAACALYRDGQAHKLLLVVPSGDASEQAANGLRQAAIKEGIPEADVVVSAVGTEIDASVSAVAKTLEEQKLSRVLVSGPFYRLPRIKLCCQRAGLDPHVAPAARDEVPFKELRSILPRELGLLWLCHLQPLLM